MLSKYKPDKNISKQLMLYEERRREKNNQVMTWVSFAVEGIFRLTFAVWEKTEEDALGSEVATTFDGFSRRFVFSCYVNSRYFCSSQWCILSMFCPVHVSTPKVSRKMPSTAKHTQVITWLFFYYFTFLIKHQLFRNIFVGSKYFYNPFLWIGY